MNDERDAIIERLKGLCLEQENTAMTYRVRLLRITIAAERELMHIEKHGCNQFFPEEIIRLAEGKA